MNIVVPYASNDLLRYRAFTRVIEHLRVIDEPYVAHDSHVPYWLSFAVNKLVRELQGKVLVINYADVMVSHAQMMRAIMLAEQEPGQVFAFDEYHRIGEPEGDFHLPIGEVNSNGCMAIRRDCFLEVGGYDERFVGWAMEDLEFNDRCGRRWPARRVPGRLEHLWHGERRDDDSALETSSEQVAANRAYYSSLSGQV